jgi:tRNA threonylcarbamoyladenosine biosynthesis protein TsaE
MQTMNSPRVAIRPAIVCTTPEETQNLGRRLGGKLKPMDVICLAGNLGAGKTTFSEGIARGAGFKGSVMSPSFGLVRPYRAPKLMIYHIDLFRVSDLETGEIGLEDCFGDPNGAVVIEWAGAAKLYLPKDRLEIQIDYFKASRKISCRPLGPRSQELLRDFLGIL